MPALDLSDHRLWTTRYLPGITNPSTYNLLWGSAGSGKSQTMIQFFLAEIFDTSVNQNQTFFVVRKVATTIRNSVFADFKNKINDWGLEKYIIARAGMLEIQCGTNRIVFIGCDNPEKLKSLAQAKYIWVEEATELTFDDWTQITLRLRGKSVSKKRFFVTFNPISDSHWIKRVFFDERHKLEADSVLDIHGTYLDNIDKLDAEYVARMEALEVINPTMHQIYALGQWGVWDRESLFCQHFDEKKHVVDGEIKAHPDYELFLSFDFNVTNTCVLFQFIRNTGKHTTLAHINVLKCYRVGDLVQLCQTIRMEYPRMRYIINGDPAGRSRSALTLGNQSAYQIICTQLNIPDQQLQVMASAPSHFATKVISDLVFQKCVVRISKLYCGVPKQLAYTPSGIAYGDLISDFKEAKVDRLVSLDPWKKKNPDKSHALDAYRYFVFTNFRDIAADYNLSKFGVDGFD